MEPEAVASVASGRYESLDPRVIPLQKIGGSIFIGIIAAVSFVVLIIRMVTEDDSLVSSIVLLIAWLIAALLGLLLALTWPARAYRYISYKVDEQGIEIRRGVFWREVVNVPRSRVQHIDVSQGPIERRYELGKIVIYTAGTDHAKVELEGLEHGRALLIRDFLLPSGTSDAV